MLAKVSDSAVIWARRFSYGKEDSLAGAHSLLITEEGNLWVHYSVNQQANNDQKTTLIEFDTNGTYRWAKKYSLTDAGF